MTIHTPIASGDDGSAMRAIVVEAFGDADVLGLREWPRPQIGAGQVLVEVCCAGVNFADVMSRRSGYLGVTPPFVPGLEVAGVVRDVAAGVTAFSPGDRVCAMTPGGGYAELAVADARTVFAVPAGVDWPVAAALPTVVPTAYALLHEVGRVRAGERILVDAAAGGVGMVLGQMARAVGAHATGLVSTTGKAQVARGYGFDEVLTSVEVDAGALDGRFFDLALDSAGGPSRTRAWDRLAPFGMLVAYGNASGEPEPALVPADLRRTNRRAAGMSIATLAATEPRLLAQIARRAIAMVADGTVTIDVTREVPLARAADAHRDLEARRTTGKLVLTVD